MGVHELENTLMRGQRAHQPIQGYAKGTTNNQFFIVRPNNDANGLGYQVRMYEEEIPFPSSPEPILSSHPYFSKWVGSLYVFPFSKNNRSNEPAVFVEQGDRLRKYPIISNGWTGIDNLSEWLHRSSDALSSAQAFMATIQELKDERYLNQLSRQFDGILKGLGLGSPYLFPEKERLITLRL